MLSDEIEAARTNVRTDAYQMSLGEIVNMYENDEIVISPDFQRLFRWEIGQKSRLIESILLGIPLPSIFVFERDDSRWELIDGLQRVSTILEFMGILKSPDGGLMPPSILEATKYLPSLYNTVWEQSDRIPGAAVEFQMPIEKSQQLAVRRARLGVEILKRPSDERTKYDLFQRLNAGGTHANAQELRNCIIIMINREFFERLKEEASSEYFKTVTSVTDDQVERQRHVELASRFLVHTLVPYEGKLDVEEYIDEGIVNISSSDNGIERCSLIRETFSLLCEVSGNDTLRRYDGERYTGKVGLVGLEVIAVGVARNLQPILALGRQGAADFVRKKSQDFWSQPETENFLSQGMRGTTRIQRTVPFGEEWFRP